MAAAPTEVDFELKELESRLERLRSLYEQYFIGIERLEPTIPRKDVDRRIQALTRARLRNTAKRFKLQTLVQRYNSYQQYWMRTCREIENGTYARHLARAKSRFGNVVGMGGRRGRRDREAEEETQKAAERRVDATRAAEEDLQALLKEGLSGAADRVLSPLTNSPAASPAAAATAKLEESDGPATIPTPPKAAPVKVQSQSTPIVQNESPGNIAKQRLVEALEANPARRKPPTRVKEREAQEPKRPTSPQRSDNSPARAVSWSALAVGGADSGGAANGGVPVVKKVKTEVSGKTTSGVATTLSAKPPPLPTSPLRRSKNVSTANSLKFDVVTSAKRALADKLAPTQQARPKEQVAAVSKADATTRQRPVTTKQGPARNVSVSNVAGKTADAGKARAAAVNPVVAVKRVAAAKPAVERMPVVAAKPVGSVPANAPARASAGMSGSRMDALHQSLVTERGKLQQKGKVSRVQLEKSLRATEEKLQTKYKGQKIDFRVVIKDGKAVVKPVIG